MNELVTIRKIEQSKLAIREIKNLDEIKKVLDQSEALKAYAKSAQMSAEIQADIHELNIRAIRKMGEITSTMKTQKGTRTDLPEKNMEVTKTGALKSVNIDLDTANEAERIARIPENIFEERIALAKETAGKITKSLFKGVINELEKSELPKPQRQDNPRTWNYIFESRMSFADQDEYIAELFILANDMPDDDSRVEFFQGCIKACKRAIAEMGY